MLNIKLSKIGSSESPVFLLLKIFRSLSYRRQFQLFVLLCLMQLSALSELFSLGAVFPFLATISEPKILWDIDFVRFFSVKYLNLTSPHELLLPSSIIFCVVVLITTIIRLFNIWLNGRLAAAVSTDLSTRVYKTFISHSYLYHISKNSSNFISSIVNQINRTSYAINSLLQLLTALFISIFLFAGLLFVNARIAIFSGLFFILIYVALAFSFRKELNTNSRQIFLSSRLQIKVIQEAVGGIRDVILDSNHRKYIDIFEDVDKPYRLRLAKNQFLGYFQNL